MNSHCTHHFDYGTFTISIGFVAPFDVYDAEAMAATARQIVPTVLTNLTTLLDPAAA